ncbi:MAG: flagellin, partial [Planctomycetes bacterium]|nr:flagellin [Planctomycetota bacterium]
NPAGLIISEMLRSQMSGIDRAMRNTQEANNMMSIAEGGLGSVSSMLTQMRGLAIHALNSGVTTGAQTTADQMQMNSALSIINRVVSTTNYAGTNLLDGTRDFTYETSDPSGIIDSSNTRVNSTTGTNQVDVNYAGGQENQAERAHLEADFGGATISERQEFTVTGQNGSHTFSFAEGTSVEEMAEQINSMADSTGVNAYAFRDQGDGSTSIRLASQEYGSNAAVRVQQLSGDGFASEGRTAVDMGQDATLTVNGQEVRTNGLEASVSGSASAKIGFTEGSVDNTSIAQTGYDQDELTNADTARDASLNQVKGGMQLQLGEGGGSQDRQTVSLGNYNPASLGTVEHNGERYSLNDLYGGGAASLDRDPELALKIIDQAIADVSAGRANIGAYQANTLDTNYNNLAVALENTTRTESGIRDADFAELITQLTASQLLENSGLRQIQSANMTAQNVLALLGG